jgi:PAS domain S-box-containing protein
MVSAEESAVHGVWGMSREGIETSSAQQSHLAVLRELGVDLTRSGDYWDVLRSLHATLSDVIDTTAMVLGVFHPASQTVEIVGQIIAGEEKPGGSFPLGSGFSSQAIRSKQSLLIREWSTHGPRVQIQFASEQPGLPESGIVVPLVRGENVVGILMCQSFQPDAYSEDDLALLEIIGSFVAIVISSMRWSERMDVQLSRQVAELEAILAAMVDALLVIDVDGRIVRLNRVARELLELDGNSIVLGQPLDQELWGQWSIGAREVAEALASLTDALRRGEQQRDIEVELRRGDRRTLSFSLSPLIDPVEGPRGGVIAFRDITERTAVERLKDDVLAIASHDLKTPVAVIRGQAQLLGRRAERGSIETDDLIDGLHVITQQSDRLIVMLDTLLDLTLIEAGHLTMNPEPVDLLPLVRECVEEIATTTERHRITVRSSKDHDVAGCWDRQRLIQVLQNLVTNAIKYSPDGGLVEVDVWRSANNIVSLAVSDEGVGIAANDIPYLFDRFYRSDGTRTLSGAGLGLYICHAIVAAHGGQISAESAGPKRGSRFVVELPLKQG